MIEQTHQLTKAEEREQRRNQLARRAGRNFRSLCRRGGLKLIVIDEGNGFGLALDRRGRTYANVGPLGGQRRPYLATFLDEIPLFLSVKWFERMLSTTRDCVHYGSAFPRWIKVVSGTIAKHEPAS